LTPTRRCELNAYRISRIWAAGRSLLGLGTKFAEAMT
jgi:hypothetical protein